MAGAVTRPKGVVWSGPLREFGPGFLEELGRLGFTPWSATQQARLAAHLSRWMQAQVLGVGELTSDRLDEFLVERRATHAALYSRKALGPLLSFLDGIGLRPLEVPATPGSNEVVAAGFERYLVVECGLLPGTAAAQAVRVRRFLDGHGPAGGVGELSTAEVTATLLAEGGDHAVSSVKRLGYNLRSFLRYALLTGLIAHDLSGASVPIRARHPSLLPIGIGNAQTAALLAACDRESVVGRRDYAVILLVARLGLRAGEVARLGLDDIDWHHGEITVRGKGRRDERVPLPAEVGQGLVDYLMRSRPSDPAGLRTVFLAARAPRRPMSRVTVSTMIARVCGRAGIAPVGAHRLRHSLGEVMIRAEVPLAAIGQVLRHHDPATTANYARVDVERLRGLSRPWPAGGSGAAR
jgi:integrase